MALDAAFLELRDQLVRLRELLKVVRIEARRKCPNKEHCVPARLYDAGPELAGLLRKALAAARLGLMAVQGDGGGGTVQGTALTRCEMHLRKLRRQFREHVSGRARLADLADLADRTDLGRRQRKQWAAWVGRVEPAVRMARRQLGVATRTATVCWRELAAAKQAGITITNVAMAQQVVERRRSGRPIHGVK